MRSARRSILTALFSGSDLELPPGRPSPPFSCRSATTTPYAAGRLIAALKVKDDSLSTLTPRQAECLKWVSAGKTDDEIGSILSLSSRTVHNHIEAAKRALGVAKRSQAVFMAYRRLRLGAELA